MRLPPAHRAVATAAFAAFLGVNVYAIRTWDNIHLRADHTADRCNARDNETKNRKTDLELRRLDEDKAQDWRWLRRW